MSSWQFEAGHTSKVTIHVNSHIANVQSAILIQILSSFLGWPMLCVENRTWWEFFGGWHVAHCAETRNFGPFIPIFGRVEFDNSSDPVSNEQWWVSGPLFPPPFLSPSKPHPDHQPSFIRTIFFIYHLIIPPPPKKKRRRSKTQVKISPMLSN